MQLPHTNFKMYFSPQTIWIFSMVDYKRPSYNNGEYAYPDWAIGIGWLFASCSIAPIPIFAVIAVINAKGTTLWEVSMPCYQILCIHLYFMLYTHIQTFYFR